MDTLIGKICPFCGETINEGDSVIVCPSCNTPHHENCWYDNGGCTTPDCLYQPQDNTEEIPQEKYDLSEQLDEPEYNDENNSDKGEISLKKKDNPIAKLIPTIIDKDFIRPEDEEEETAVRRPRGLNRSISIMSFLENSIKSSIPSLSIKSSIE